MGRDLRHMRPLLRWAREVHDELEEQVRPELCGREVPPHLWGLRPGSHADAHAHRRLSCVCSQRMLEFDNAENSSSCWPCARTPLLSQKSAAEAPAEIAAVAVQLCFFSVKPGRRTTASSASLRRVEARSQVVSNLIRSIIRVDR